VLKNWFQNKNKLLRVEKLCNWRDRKDAQVAFYPSTYLLAVYLLIFANFVEEILSRTFLPWL